ncbi:Retrovirus-related Pol polyprotein from transposon opus, partial [Mucuna pruriens]
MNLLTSRYYSWKIVGQGLRGRRLLKGTLVSNKGCNSLYQHFMVIEGIVLGHLVSNKGIKVDKSKIDIITSLPNPAFVREIHSFFGHAGFYRRFIKIFGPSHCLNYYKRMWNLNLTPLY